MTPLWKYLSKFGPKARPREQFRNTIPPELRRSSTEIRFQKWRDGVADRADLIAAGVLRAMGRLHFRLPFWVIPCLTLVIGFTTGYYVCRQRRAANAVIVTVGSDQINADQLFHHMEMIAGPDSLRQMVRDRMLIHFARANGAVPSKEVVDRLVAQEMARPGYFTYMRQHHVGPEDVQERIVIKQIENNLFGTGVTVTDQEVADYYRSQCDPKALTSKYYVPETAQVQVVITRSEADAEKAWREWKEGVPFDVVVTHFSKDTSAKDGGKMPPLVRRRSAATYVPGLEDTIFAMSPGEVSRPKLFAGTWWMILCVSRTPAKVIPFDQVKEECREAVKIQKGERTNGARLKADFEAFRQSEKLQVFWNHYYFDLYGDSDEHNSAGPGDSQPPPLPGSPVKKPKHLR